MEGITKLKLAILMLFLFSVIGIIVSFGVATIEENEFVEEYGMLSYEEQEVLTDFYGKLTDYGWMYSFSGFMLYFVTGGLFLILTKLWNMNKI